MSAELITHAHGHASIHKILVGLIAGFLAVLFFHQPALLLLNDTGFINAATYSMQHTAPFGVPQVLSLSFWGGVWGVLFALIEYVFPRGVLYWIVAILFGAIFPTLVAWFVVSPLKDLPMAGGWDIYKMMIGPIINGAWGLGTALFFELWHGVTRNAHSS